MLIHREGASVLVSAPAKVNLHLEVLRRRPDGYHDLETLMVAVGLYDTLEFRDDSTGDVRLSCDRPDLSTGPENLVCRAAELLRRVGHSLRECGGGGTRGASADRLGATIRLWKRIPMAAGLAGGSSDAAATLAGLNLLWGLGLSDEELALLGAELGSDVSFFFAAPAAWCTGRGEIVRPLRLARPLFLVLACPPVGLSTAEVFRNLTVPERPLPGDEIIRAVEAGEVEEVGRRLFNRLQPAAERLCPAVGRLRERLAAQRPAGVLMSGSGSTVFALCRDAEEALCVSRGLLPGWEEGVRPRIHSVRSCL
jgi:4-diphosphocytidyl-2-C-methyl-D-erythritol kinase